MRAWVNLSKVTNIAIFPASSSRKDKMKKSSTSYLQLPGQRTVVFSTFLSLKQGLFF